MGDHSREEIKQWVKEKQAISWRVVGDLIEQLEILEKSQDRILRRIAQCDQQIKTIHGEFKDLDFFDAVEEMAFLYTDLKENII